MTPFTKSAFTLAVVVIFAIATAIVSRGYSFVVVAPKTQLSSFPLEFNGWQGAPEELKDGVANVLDTSDMLSVRYSRGTDGPIFVHAASWTNPDSVAETCPHHPNICYRGNGWIPVERRRIEVQIKSVGDIPIEMNVMQRGDQKVVIAYCYRMGEQFFADETEARRVQIGLWGQRNWPYVTKFMIQTPNSSIDAAKPVVQEFVQQFFNWHKV